MMCFTSSYGNKICRLKDVVMDFSKVKTVGEKRSFAQGFLIIPIKSQSDHSVLSETMLDIPGLQYVYGNEEEVLRVADWNETDAVFVNSNDDYANLAHYMDDVMTMWTMLVVSRRPAQSSVLLNFDALRKWGPAGPGRVMDRKNPDAHGRFSTYFHSWFKHIKKAVDYGQKKVLFSEIYFRPFPGIGWLWRDLSVASRCSYMGPSSLFQSFSLYIRRAWLQKFGKESVSQPSVDTLTIVFLLRGAKKSKKGSAERVIANEEEVARALKSIPNTNLIMFNGMKISFLEQYKAVSSASVIVSMHGAGLAHVFHASIGHPGCCAVIELFPKETNKQSYVGIKGTGNWVRYLGMYYWSYVNEGGFDSDGRSIMAVDALKSQVEVAVSSVRKKASCIVSGVRNTEQ